MKKLSKRILSVFLAIILSVSIMPCNALKTMADTNDTANEIIAVARSQKGGYGSDDNKFTRWHGKISGYGSGGYAYPWCATFLMWCANQVGVYKKAIPNNVGCSGMKGWFSKRGEYHAVSSNYTPQKGDIVFFDTAGKGTYNHVEFVAETGYIVKSGKKYLKCIGGNTSNSNFKGADYVAEKTRKITESSCKVVGYAHPNYGNAPSYKITTKTSTNETNYSAKLNCTVSPSMNVQAIGLFYSTDENDINKITADTKKDDGGNHIWYLLYENSNSKKMSDYSFDTAKTITQNKYKIKFLPGKKYYYNFVFKANGKWYISDKGSFKTKNNPPKEVTNLRLEKTNASLNDSVWVAWNSVSGADNYRVSVENSKGDIEVYKTTTNCSFTIPKREKADTYTVYVRAENESGVSHYTPVSYVVHSNVTVSFSDGYKLNDLTEQTQSKPVLYNGSVITPVAPERVGYTFKGWSDNGKIYAESTKIDNITSSKSIVGTWSANKYSIKIVDGITNEVIKEFMADFDTKIDMTDYANLAPQHNGYTFSGWSEDSYTVNSPESHTIYARYKWNSKFKINTIIDSVTRAKSKASLTSTDGYSVNIKVSSPSISNGGIDSTVKGRVIVVLKTKAGRMLIETESSAFVLYPDQDNEVSKVINVFVPFESSDKDDLAYSVEAYVVNKYSSAGTISDSAIDTSKIALANSNDWQFTTTKPVVGTNNVIAVNSDLSI